MPIDVVVVDSQKLVRQGLVRLLGEFSDLRVIGEAGNGLEAVELVRTAPPDIMVLDIALPLLNGMEVTRRVHSRQPDVRIIGLSAHTEERFIIEMLKGGANAYLTKNSDKEELVEAIRRVHAGQTYLSPLITDAVLKHVFDQSKHPEGLTDHVLSAREREVLQLVAEGKSSRDIATLLNISMNTIIRHRQNITTKLGISGVAELTRYAVREGLVNIE